MDGFNVKVNKGVYEITITDSRSRKDKKIRDITCINSLNAFNRAKKLIEITTKKDTITESDYKIVLNKTNHHGSFEDEELEEFDGEEYDGENGDIDEDVTIALENDKELIEKMIKSLKGEEVDFDEEKDKVRDELKESVKSTAKSVVVDESKGTDEEEKDDKTDDVVMEEETEEIEECT